MAKRSGLNADELRALETIKNTFPEMSSDEHFSLLELAKKLTEAGHIAGVSGSEIGESLKSVLASIK